MWQAYNQQKAGRRLDHYCQFVAHDRTAYARGQQVMRSRVLGENCAEIYEVAVRVQEISDAGGMLNTAGA